MSPHRPKPPPPTPGESHCASCRDATACGPRAIPDAIGRGARGTASACRQLRRIRSPGRTGSIRGRAAERVPLCLVGRGRTKQDLCAPACASVLRGWGEVGRHARHSVRSVASPRTNAWSSGAAPPLRAGEGRAGRGRTAPMRRARTRARPVTGFQCSEALHGERPAVNHWLRVPVPGQARRRHARRGRKSAPRGNQTQCVQGSGASRGGLFTGEASSG